MRSAWRVACVRIPRFPIGALWRARQGAPDTPATDDATAQLTLALPPTPSPARPATRPATPPSPTPTRSAGGAAPASPPSAAAAPIADAHWDARPIAVADGDAGPARRLRVVSAAAGRMGVRAGMTVAAARARCAALVVWPWDEDAVRRATDAVSALLLVASPQVTPVAGGPGLWWVGAGGLEGVGGERGLARALHRLAGAWHPGARIGVADSCVAARAATWDYGPPEPVVDPYAEAYARFLPAHERPAPARPAAPDAPRGCVVVPRGGCAHYLATVPIALVQMDAEVRAGLSALGVRTAGGLAALDAGDVEARWGPAGMSAWRLARGEDRRRPGVVRVDARRSVSAELASPTTTMEPVLFLVRAALDRLAADLARDALGAAVVALTLHLDVGATHTVTREARLPRPQARVAPLFERCRALLERAALPGPVCGVTVSVPATGRLGADQGDLLSPAWHDPAAVEAAFARLRAEFGPNVVVRAVSRDSHRPERAGQWLPVDAVDEPPPAGDDAPAPDTDASAAPAPHPPAALRLLDPPEAAAVAPDAAGAPSTVHWRGRALAVTRADGPERLSGEWWADPYRRDYWRCATPAGLLLAYRDRAAGGWWVQGWYD